MPVRPHYTGAMSQIITGEAVVLELRAASFAARSLGAAIDVIATVLLFLLGLWAAAGLATIIDFTGLRAVILLVVVGIVVGIPVAVETLTRGRSLGKLIVGLRVVRDDGGSIRFRHALIRVLLAVLEIYATLGSIAFMVSLFNDKSKRLGDMLAGTYAIRERAPKEPPLQVYTIPALQPWAMTADIGRIPDNLARRISLYLRNAAAMAPTSRQSMGATLATEASGFVAPQPPYGTAPESFLAALISERRERELMRLRAGQSRAETMRQRLNAQR